MRLPSQNYMIRRDLCARFDERCAYCKRPTGLRAGTVDHYMPRALGGSDEPANLRWACLRCNGLKADMAPEDWERRIRAIAPKPSASSIKAKLLQFIARRRLQIERGTK